MVIKLFPTDPQISSLINKPFIGKKNNHEICNDVDLF